MKELDERTRAIFEQLQIDAYDEDFMEVFDKIITDGFDIEPIYTVKELANLIDTSEHTIRYYDNLNMFPFVRRDRGNRRLFSKLDAFLGRSINCFRSVDYTLDECKEANLMALKGDATIPERTDLLRRKKQELEEQKKELEIKLQKIQHKLEYFEQLETEVKQEMEAGTFVDKGRSSLKNCRLFIQKRFYEAGLVDSIDIDIE